LVLTFFKVRLTDFLALKSSFAKRLLISSSRKDIDGGSPIGVANVIRALDACARTHAAGLPCANDN